MKCVVVSFSQTGQLKLALEHFCKPLKKAGWEIEFVEIKCKTGFPYPWSFWRFFETMPLCVLEKSYDLEYEMEAHATEKIKESQLVVLGLQPWFLSPSVPVNSFLNSRCARELCGKPVVAMVACRKMWWNAVQRVAHHVDRLGGIWKGYGVISLKKGAFVSHLTTPLWLLTGKKNIGGKLIPSGALSEDLFLLYEEYGAQMVLHQAKIKDGQKADIFAQCSSMEWQFTYHYAEKWARLGFPFFARLINTASKKGFLWKLVHRLAILSFLGYLIFMIVFMIPIIQCVTKVLQLGRSNQNILFEREKLHT